jgi:hypothetical protein
VAPRQHLLVVAEQNELPLQEFFEKPSPVADDNLVVHIVFRPRAREEITSVVPELRLLAVAHLPQVHLMRITLRTITLDNRVLA